jgi:5S rRNA maturation endonuclease (ribonuclease M5)
VFSTLKPIINKEWKQKLSSDALQYLDNRLITRSPFYKDTFYSVYDKNNNEYILIPWKVNSIECYYQLNDFKKIDKFNRKYIFPSKIEKPVFGLDNIDLTWNKIIICEGVYDSLFVKNGICCGGKTLTDYQLKLIKERYPRHEIIISLDNDEAGLKSVANIIKKTPVKFKFFKWFNNNTIEKDINDYVLKTNDVNIFSNKDKLDKMIVSSVEMKLFLISKGLW